MNKGLKFIVVILLLLAFSVFDGYKREKGRQGYDSLDLYVIVGRLLWISSRQKPALTVAFLRDIIKEN